MNEEASTLDSELTKEQKELASLLTPDDLVLIDRILLSDASVQQRKVARLVGSACMWLKDVFPGLPDVFYSQRIANLVEEGYLESFGNLRRMRFSEVKLTDKAYEKALSLEGKKAYEEYSKKESFIVGQSRYLSQNKKYDEALNLLNLGLTIYPNSKDIYSALSLLYFSLDDVKNGFNSLDQAILIAPDKTVLYFQKATKEFELGMYDKSIDNFTKIIDAKDEYFIGSTYNYRAMAYLHLKKYHEALDDYNRIPEDYDIGSIYKRWDNKNRYFTKQEIFDISSKSLSG